MASRGPELLLFWRLDVPVDERQGEREKKGRKGEEGKEGREGDEGEGRQGKVELQRRREVEALGASAPEWERLSVLLGNLLCRGMPWS
ncbi:hypothetical protein TRIUR3_15880 [Triticum urartu]|uniref:Uncharacterized protein n=1 Tax=Triticum urartu TaxID=4572 RepID=M7ZR16_TRIUA|nr:hypothetical protein TRIUR3_15880 [Triticum urartu]